MGQRRFELVRAGLFVARLTAAGELDVAVVPGGRRLVTVPGLGPWDLGEFRVGNVVAGPGGTLLVPLAPWGADGIDPSVVRLLPSGDVDTSFGNDGLTRIAAPTSTRGLRECG